MSEYCNKCGQATTGDVSALCASCNQEESELAPVSLFGLTVGQPATLEENDCFGSTCNVVVLQIHKGGNVIVQDGNVKREVSARNLRPNADSSESRA